MMQSNNKVGFTLIELLVTVGILTILASVLVNIINPRQVLSRTNNAIRVRDVKIIRDAVDNLSVVTQGVVNCGGLSDCPTSFSVSGVDSLSELLLQNKMLKAVPKPPVQPTDPMCQYQILLYPKSENKYELKWCYENWSQDKVNQVNGNSRYSCEWLSDTALAVCKTGTDYDIPSP